MRSLLPKLVLLVALPWSGAAPAATSADVLPSLNPVLERVSPGVVNISVKAFGPDRRHPLFTDPLFRHFFGIPDLPAVPRQRRVQSVGSGVVIDAVEGYVVTNHHVVDGADEVTVTLNDRRTLDAEVVGSDPEADVALLRVAADDLTAVPFGDSDRLRIGDFVIAIGNPFGLGQTATLGIVGALGRTGLGIEGYENFIQTDASINPGNSGGALIDQRGRLVGINTAIISRSGGNNGIGFAIPANMVRAIVAQIIEHGEVRRGRLGVLVQDITPDIAEAAGLAGLDGALVANVESGGAAEAAGLRAGDVVVALDGVPIATAAQLRNAVGLRRPGAAVELVVMRDGEPRTLRAVLRDGDGATEGPSAAASAIEGAVLGEIPPSHELYGRGKGVFVAAVALGSPAQEIGLRPGDVIVEAAGRPTETVADLRRALASHDGDKPVLLRVRRGDGALFLTLPAGA